MVDLDNSLWFALRTVVSVVFTASLLTCLVLWAQRSRNTRRGGDEG
ncbi:hypothetical protein [Streptomyces longisporoflavus]|uniref:Uncharacterized protein n=1 Tax=Streptomyces longisporoflavus TaxID=28044 RepID=A0ABW7R412_9ACTN